MTHDAINQARTLFPRGLTQPEGSFRFSIDALLLASFAHGGARSMLDLGTGCGVVGLAYCLLHEQCRGLGIELEKDLATAACHNARMLGLAERFHIMQADLAMPQSHADYSMPLANYDLVLSNPPYRLPNSGRAAASPMRQQALFESAASLDDFIRNASKALRNGGRCALIYGAQRLPDLIIALRHAGLEPKRLRMVHSRLDGPARLVLVESMKGAKAELRIEPPLILYEGQGSDTKLSAQALAFSPFLACNAQRSA